MASFGIFEHQRGARSSENQSHCPLDIRFRVFDFACFRDSIYAGNDRTSQAGQQEYSQCTTYDLHHVFTKIQVNCMPWSTIESHAQ